MTNPQSILRDSAVALPVLVAVGAMDGTLGMASVLAGGLLALVNFAALTWAVVRGFSGDGENGGLVAAVLVMKMPMLLGGLWLLMSWFEPMYVGLGASCVVLGALFRGTVDAFSQPAHLVAEEA